MQGTDILTAIRQIAAERGIEVEEIVEAIRHAISQSFKEADATDGEIESGTNVEVEIDLDQGSINVYADKKVVEVVTNPATQISLEDAQQVEPKLQAGDHVLVEITDTGDFGRVAAQASKQVILQKLRESEREAMINQFKDKIGSVESGIVQRMDREGNVFFEIQRATAKMPPAEQIKGEYYKSSARMKVLLKKIQVDAKGKILIVSRSDSDFLRGLFELEVPEISSGTVDIVNIAREAGSRSKVAVRSNADGVDAIGSCVGQRGARISSITNELKTMNTEEKIDIIEWEEDITDFIANAVKPAEALEVKVINEDEHQALIIVEDEYLSLAIGREGQNVRLAAKLTGWSLDIQGRNMYEENGRKSKFEGAKVSVSPKVEEDSQGAVDEDISDDATSEIASLELSSRVETALESAGIKTISELQERVASGDKIDGIGPKSLEEIKSKI